MRLLSHPDSWIVFLIIAHYGPLFILPGGTDLRQDILLHCFVVFINDVQEADPVHPPMGQDAGDVEIPEGADQLPPAVVELPDLVLFKT